MVQNELKKRQNSTEKEKGCVKNTCKKQMSVTSYSYITSAIRFYVVKYVCLPGLFHSSDLTYHCRKRISVINNINNGSVLFQCASVTLSQHEQY